MGLLLPVLVREIKSEVEKPLRIQIANEPDIEPALDAAIVRLQQRAFPQSEHFKISRHYKHVAQKGDFRVLAWLDNQLVGQVLLVWGNTRFKTEPRPRAEVAQLHLAGIGNVCSDPDFRGVHAASVCMERALELARKQGGEGSLLFCGSKLEQFYARFGYAIIRNEVFFMHPDGTVFKRDYHDVRMGMMFGNSPWPSGDIYFDIDDF